MNCNDYQFRALSVTPFGAKPPVETPIVLEEDEIIDLHPADVEAA